MRLPGFGALAPVSLIVGISLHVFGAISAQTLDYIGMYAVGWVLWRLIAFFGTGEIASLIAAVGVVSALGWIQALNADIRYMPYILVIPANILATWVFSRNFVSGRTAVLVDLIEIMGLRPVDPRFRRFVEGQCLLWSVMCFGMAVVAALAMVWAAQRPVFAALLSGLAVAQIIWFLLSHYYASFRYGRPETWALTLRTMVRPDVWARLGVQ